MRYILASRSPRRLELLRLIVPADAIAVVPPASSEEPGFDALTTWNAIAEHLRQVARGKLQQVLAQRSSSSDEIVIAADTVIVVADQSTSDHREPKLHVLGQPPDSDTWRDVVRHWFTDYYAGRTHRAATAVCVAFRNGHVTERVVSTEVTMRADVEPWLDWYLSTGEPRGKAGGYALQGAASVFIESVRGSLSNVVGLPLEALIEMMEEHGMC